MLFSYQQFCTIYIYIYFFAIYIMYFFITHIYTCFFYIFFMQIFQNSICKHIQEIIILLLISCNILISQYFIIQLLYVHIALTDLDDLFECIPTMLITIIFSFKLASFMANSKKVSIDNLQFY